ncbi:hypothetical protein AC249_AIPGENE17038 [Exaiptasia diaphana]|nr:hypothetical protein AC249_AIPGENE17038 [Exaiptasia diaphana]
MLETDSQHWISLGIQTKNAISATYKTAKKREKRVENGEEEEYKKKQRKLQRLDRVNSDFTHCHEADLLHSFTTLEAGMNLQRMATDLQNFSLLAKLSKGDVIAIEAKYHMRCLTNVRNMHRSLERKKKSASATDEEDEDFNEARAFIELVDCIENSVMNGTQLFLLPELHALYENRLKDFGMAKTVNRFRLKNKILEHYTDAKNRLTDDRQLSFSRMVYKMLLKKL